MTPAIAPARVASDHVQGIDSSLSDLVLRDGRKVAVEIGGAIQPTPTLKRTIAGSSSVELDIHDSDLAFLDASLLAEKFDAQIDGLWFRYMGADLDPPQIKLTLQDRNVAILSEHKGPISAYRKDMTRAEFIVARVREALPHIKVVCPRLHDILPIKTERQGKKAKEEAKQKRGKGIGDSKGLKVKGATVTAAQHDLGDRALRVAESHKAPFKVCVALIAALIDESEMGAASSNVLQAEPFIAEGASTPAEAEIAGFLTGKDWTGTGAIPYFKAHPDSEPADIATNVQRNRDGASSYAPFVAEAREWVEAYGGGEFASGSRTVTEPFTFEIREDEDYWAGIKREAKAVNWLAFFVADTFFYIDEIELFRGMVRLAIDRDTPGIEKIAGSFRANRPATDVTVTAFAKKWTVPPGAVVTLAAHGPFSIGFGDAPAKANAKGQKIGLSSNRNAKTGEGRARYLVETIEAPQRDSDVSDLKRVTIKLRRPTAPLPEPTAKTKTVSVGGSGDAPPEIEKVIAEIDRIDAKHYPYSSPGARGTPPPADGPYDCSGCVSRWCYVGGFLRTTIASAELAQAFEPGAGEWLTIFAKGPDGPSGHTFLRVRTPSGWRYAGTSSTNPSGGAGWIDDSAFDPSYLAEFQQRHPKGF